MGRLASMMGIGTGVALTVGAAATIPSEKVDKTIYRAAPANADRYIALRTQDYKDALAPAPDGRVLFHLPYPAEVAASIDTIEGIELAYRTKQCDMLPVAAAAAERMIRAANNDLHGTGSLRVQSCFRSIPEQVGIFCNGVRDQPTAKCQTPAKRAEESAPPAYSEHATGYTADFVACSAGRKMRCGGLEERFAGTDPGKWMMQHAREYGFELSFPCPSLSHDKCATKTAQGVSFEPWHWRWVGCTAATPGATRARQIFAEARRRFPANPGIDDNTPPAIDHCTGA